MTYPEDFINKIICGDCIDVMKSLEADSIDTIITDPPYDLSTVNRFKAKDSGDNWNVKSGVFHRTSKGFMGKEWDGTQIAFKKETWEECLRVAKPGATLMAFGGTRTYHRMACAIEDAGWVLKDCIMWLYGSGFPKATDISKQLDKGHKREITKIVKRTGKEKGTYGAFEGNNKETAPTTPEAKLWNGWKSHGLKPAYEPILVAMKPNEGTYANNALKHGVSGLNIDGGRIDIKDGDEKTKGGMTGNKSGRVGYMVKDDKSTFVSKIDDTKGRFPANILMSCDCDYKLKHGIIKEDKKKLLDWLYENA